MLVANQTDEVNKWGNNKNNNNISIWTGDRLCEVIGDLCVLKEIHQQVDGVVPGQGAVPVHRYIENELKRLVDVFGIEKLKRPKKETKSRDVQPQQQTEHLTESAEYLLAHFLVQGETRKNRQREDDHSQAVVTEELN